MSRRIETVVVHRLVKEDGTIEVLREDPLSSQSDSNCEPGEFDAAIVAIKLHLMTPSVPPEDSYKVLEFVEDSEEYACRGGKGLSLTPTPVAPGSCEDIAAALNLPHPSERE